MAFVIDLPPTLEYKVKAEAQKRQRPPEQIGIDRLAQTFADDGVPTVVEVVARIKATPPNPAMITPPQGDLAEALRNGPTDPDFDLKGWQQGWATAEGEMKRINLKLRFHINFSHYQPVQTTLPPVVHLPISRYNAKPIPIHF